MDVIFSKLCILDISDFITLSTFNFDFFIYLGSKYAIHVHKERLDCIVSEQIPMSKGLRDYHVGLPNSRLWCAKWNIQFHVIDTLTASRACFQSNGL